MYLWWAIPEKSKWLMISIEVPELWPLNVILKDNYLIRLYTFWIETKSGNLEKYKELRNKQAENSKMK